MILEMNRVYETREDRKKRILSNRCKRVKSQYNRLCAPLVGFTVHFIHLNHCLWYEVEHIRLGIWVASLWFLASILAQNRDLKML